MSDPPAAFSRDPRCHMLAVVLMAGYALRAMNRLRRGIPGGLNGAHILLHVVLADRDARLAPAGSPLDRAMSDAARSIVAIGDAVGLPRETVRRNLIGLAEAQWLEHVPESGYRPSAKACQWFAVGDDGSALAEFRWIAGQVNATLVAVTDDVEQLLVRHPWHIALATQREALPHAPYPDDVESLRARLRAADASHRERLANVVDRYLYRHLGRLRHAFDGDLLLPVLIGEIAHRNISALAHNANPAPEAARLSVRFTATPPDAPLALAPINAHSLSLTMGIPDATVRRKVAHLCRRGWVVAEPSGTLRVGAAVQRHTAALNDDSLADMMDAYRALRAMGVGA